MDALEQEKQGLQSQIAQVLEGRQQLAHLKMSLSLEVATYRYGLMVTSPSTQIHTCSEAEAPLQGPRAMGRGSCATSRFRDSTDSSQPRMCAPTLKPTCSCGFGTKKVSCA